MLGGITTEQMIEVDRIMMEDLQIPVELMMEHAGLNLARLVRSVSTGSVLIVAGSGNNGGGGLTCGRRLVSWGYAVTVFLPKGKEKLREVPLRQLERLQNISEVEVIEDLSTMKMRLDEFSVVVDAYIGYGFTGTPDEISVEVFSMMRRARNLICLDSPSGVNTSTGEDFSNLKPVATCTIAFPKIGHLRESMDLGKFYLIDIGVPKSVYQRLLNIEHNNRLLSMLYEKFSLDPLVEIERYGSGWKISS